MRRALLAVVVTIGAVVAILSYHSPSAIKSAPTPPKQALPPQVRKYVGPREHAVSPDGRIDYGLVRVAITVKAGRIVGITTPLLPPSGDSAGKGTRATTGLLSRGSTAILIRKALASQSPKLHTVSGATWTSQAFLTSLQAAMAEAGLDGGA